MFALLGHLKWAGIVAAGTALIGGGLLVYNALEDAWAENRVLRDNQILLEAALQQANDAARAAKDANKKWQQSQRELAARYHQLQEADHNDLEKTRKLQIKGTERSKELENAANASSDGLNRLFECATRAGGSNCSD